MVQLGKSYRDHVTGFEGIATARYEYLNGCVRFGLEAPTGEDGKPRERVFDEERLVDPATFAQPAGRVESTSGGPRGSIEDLATR